MGGGSQPHAAASTHPLQPMLTGTLALVSQYDTTIAGQPGLAGQLAPLRAEHWTHVTALLTAMGRPVPSDAPSPVASGPPAASPAEALVALRTAEHSAQTAAVSACVAAPARYAELLGSIAACRATHLEVL